MLKQKNERFDQQIMNKISLMQDHDVVKDYSRSIRKASKNVKVTNKEMSMILDPLVASKRRATL